MSKQIVTKTDKLQNMLLLALPEREHRNYLMRITQGRAWVLEELNDYELTELEDGLSRVVKMINPAQLRKLHCLYRSLNVAEDRKNILLHFTQQRTDSTAFLSFDEAQDLIRQLTAIEPAQKLRRSIFSRAYEIGIIFGDTDTDKKINPAKLNMFLRERGAVKKDLNKQSEAELKKTLAQMMAMKKNNQQTAENKQARQATNELLSELNIPFK